MARDIKESKYLAVWSEFPIPGCHSIRADRAHAHMAQICSWARLCRDNAIPFIMFGSFGKKWGDPQVKAMVDDRRLHMAYHRLCHFGIKMAQAVPR